MNPVERRALVDLSAALAAGESSTLVRAMEHCMVAGDPAGAEEVILQSYLFLGYPAALNAFGMWRKISGRDASPPVPDAWEAWAERGESVCRTVYGGEYEGLRRNVRALHPDMERWMVVEGYGKVLGRGGLPLVIRELCVAALLAVLGAPRQLHSHLRGALNAGATREEVEEALKLANRHMGIEGRAEARAVWTQVRERWLRARLGGREPGDGEGGLTELEAETREE